MRSLDVFDFKLVKKEVVTTKIITVKIHATCLIGKITSDCLYLYNIFVTLDHKMKKKLQLSQKQRSKHTKQIF